jgi:hypothetical protein
MTGRKRENEKRGWRKKKEKRRKKKEIERTEEK